MKCARKVLFEFKYVIKTFHSQRKFVVKIKVYKSFIIKYVLDLLHCRKYIHILRTIINLPNIGDLYYIC